MDDRLGKCVVQHRCPGDTYAYRGPDVGLLDSGVDDGTGNTIMVAGTSHDIN